MDDRWEEGAGKFIGEIKAALQQVQRRLDAENLTVSKLELELKTTVEKSADGGFSFKIIDLEGTVSTENERILSVSLVPKGGGAELMAGVSEELVAAIEAIVLASKAAAEIRPPFGLDEATVSLAVGMHTEGSVKILVGGSTSRERAHTMTFTLRQATSKTPG